MGLIAWLVLGAYFVLMVVVGYWARKRVKNASDFFTAGGSMPWWLSGISHHMSGYSSAVFVGYAALAYTQGISTYFWWALSIALSLLAGVNLFPGKWARMRQRLHVISPLEYLKIRYNLPTQQLIGWSGALLKIFDVGAKWSASAILLHVFANVPIPWGVLLTGGVTVIYSVMGGLWADALTDLSQFVIQLIAGFSILFATMVRLGGVSSLWRMWRLLPPDHLKPFHGDYTVVFAAAYFFVNILSYNGGGWSLAQRFIAAPTAKDARRSSLLSAALYLVWPPILFFPMWAAPILLPHLKDPTESYALLTRGLLPSGLIGLVLAGLFAHTMAMTSSDANAVSAVIVRDIVPVLRGGRQRLVDAKQLLLGRVTTFLFLGHQHVPRAVRQSLWRSGRHPDPLVRCPARTHCDPYAAWPAAAVQAMRARCRDQLLGDGSCDFCGSQDFAAATSAPDRPALHQRRDRRRTSGGVVSGLRPGGVIRALQASECRRIP